MTSIKLICILTLVIFFVPRARATIAEEMLSACRPISTAKVANGQINLPQDFESGQCWGAFEVLESVLETRSAETHQSLFGVCLPADVSRTELIAVFIKYMGLHPEKYHEDFTVVAIPAMWETFHCKS